MNDWNAVDGSLAMALEATRPYDGSRRFVVVRGGTAAAPSKATPVRYAYIVFALALSLFLAVVGLNAYKSYSAYRALAQAPLVTIDVQQGETLWDIARTHGIEGVPVTQLMEAIKEWNNMDVAQLNVGQKLLVPQGV